MMAPQLYNSPQPTFAASSAALTRRQGTTLLNRNCFFNSPISHQGTTISSSWSSRGITGIKCATSVSGLSATTTSTTPSISSFNELIESLISRVDLSESEAERSLDFLLNEANEALISAFLVLLRAKGETYEEVTPLSLSLSGFLYCLALF
ncbi:hypothetical protein RHGRI_024381 [Rhododendron griersonianum]|uniref:Glycosyl transferase family 3 N-terminal domain-containing protein n=1 Tax=Rhododendron griersonianum TaxID=479676 RepID=A0AAV6J944_9ERIC|nr:hypothetical protein RHGRI_024381 [Rhododendron griersonianum]